MRDTTRKPRKTTEKRVPPAGINKEKLKTIVVPTPRKPRVKTEGPVPPGGVNIFIDDAGRPFCEPYYGHADPGAQVRWCFDGPWTIVFKNRTPLKSGQSVVHGYGNEPPVRIDGNAEGHYPYDVMAFGVDDHTFFRQPTPTIFVDLACPEMIFP
jgi:hypothetical protein